MPLMPGMLCLDSNCLNEPTPPPRPPSMPAYAALAGVALAAAAVRRVRAGPKLGQLAGGDMV